jgi:hypothetical protein
VRNSLAICTRRLYEARVRSCDSATAGERFLTPPDTSGSAFAALPAGAAPPLAAGSAPSVTAGSVTFADVAPSSAVPSDSRKSSCSCDEWLFRMPLLDEKRGGGSTAICRSAVLARPVVDGSLPPWASSTDSVSMEDWPAGSGPRPGCQICRRLSATSREVSRSQAPYTIPMPPRPSTRRM